MTYAERLNILEVRRLKFDLVMIYCSVHGLNALDFSDFFNITPVHVVMLLNLVNILAVLNVVLLVLQSFYWCVEQFRK